MECDESFKRMITQQEGLLFDRKAYVELLDDRCKADFIKDIIAFANTSRFTGKESELILGVNDDGTVRGIVEMINKCRGGLDGIKRIIKDLILNFIKPELCVVGIEAVNCDGHIVLTIKIPALPTEDPFKVKKKLALLDIGQSWIRTGESNAELTPPMERFYPAYTKCPYIFPEQWQDYFANLQERFIHSYTIEGYQELLSTNGKEVVEEIREFLESNAKILVLTGYAAIGKTTILERFACGRAELLEGDIRNHENYKKMYYPIGFIPIFVSLSNMQLYEVYQMETILVDRLCEGLKFQHRRPEELYRLFENPRYHFVVIFNGIDELLSEQASRRFIRTLEDMARRYPELKFILATRPPLPSFAEEYRNEIVEVRIQPFTPEQIRKYIEVRCDSETLEKVKGVIYADEELKQICSIPYYLETALSEIIGEYFSRQEGEVMVSEQVQIAEEEVNKVYSPKDIKFTIMKLAQTEELTLDQPIEVRTEAKKLENITIEERDIRIGVMLDRIYWKAWIRETQKRNFHPDTTRGFWNQTEKLAISVNLGEEISDEQIGLIMRKRAKLFCLSLSVLTETEEMRAVRFFNELTQIIFAANNLKGLIKKDPKRFHNKFNQLSVQFREKITPALKELSPIFYMLNSQEE